MARSRRDAQRWMDDSFFIWVGDLPEVRAGREEEWEGKGREGSGERRGREGVTVERQGQEEPRGLNNNSAEE